MGTLEGDNNQFVQDIIVLTTGGTIEKTYDEFDGSLENRETSIHHSIRSRLRLPYTSIQVCALMAKDSLNMDDEDRNIIVEAIRSHNELASPIVVLHGTDTMEHTAALVHEQLKDELNIPVVFTGAMKPLGFYDSDGTQNLTEALIVAKLLAPGVYISFHNRVFPLPGVRKNKEERTFESI